MSRSLLVRGLLSLAPLMLALTFVAPQVFGRTPPSALQVLANPQSIPPRIAAATQTYHPLLYKAYYGFDSVVSIQNLSTATANCVLDFYSGGILVFSYIPNPLAANRVLTIAANGLTSLPSNFVGTMTISSDQPVQTLVTHSATTGADRYMAYKGISPAEASTQLFLGPFIKSATGSSAVTVENIGTSSTNLSFDFIDPSGAVVFTYASAAVLNPGGALNVTSAGGLVGLPANFNGSVRVSSTPATPLVGIVNFQDTDRTLLWTRPAMTGGTSNYLPRFYRSATDADGLRTTRLTLLNMSSSAANASVMLYDASGIATLTTPLSIASGGMATFDPTGISSIPAGFAGSAVISSDQPLGLTEITSYDGTPTHTSNADSYSIPSTTTSDTRIPLPQVLFAAGYQSVVHVQNVAPLSSTIQLMLETSFTSTRNNVPANAAVRFDRNSMGVGYNGSGMLTSGSAINALVDIEAAALPPPATATATATVTATAAVTVTAVPATQVPTPTLPASPGVTPTLYLNYLTGAPGSSFLISGYNFPPTSSVALQINSVLAVSLTTDANGSFRLLLNAPSNALPGFYVVTAVVVSAPAGVTLAQVHAPTGKIGVFELVTSGPNAVVRTAPANAPATSANIPATAAANPLTSPPYTYLPLVRK